jgi:uncharacterized membrane protein YidH (DUF202 family)
MPAESDGQCPMGAQRCVIRCNWPVGEALSDPNDPRVFFAAERTLMAWTRTALTLMGFGLALERFGLFSTC